MPSNTAAFFTAVKAPLEVKSAEYPSPKENEIVIKAKAVAINPCDYAMQMFGPAIFKWLKLPCPIGEDVAGEVEAVGSNVNRFKVGDRVAGLTTAAFQEYVILSDHMALSIPPALSYEQAAVIPMGLSVAAVGLFGKDYLALQLPSLSPKPIAEAVLIWGGSTSVGSNAIQLAAAAGYEVITTASPANFERAKSLGATSVFDYNSPTIKDDLLAAFKGKTCAGAFTNGGVSPMTHPPVIDACAAVVRNTPGRKFLALTMAPPKELPEGVETKFVEALQMDKDLAYTIFGDYVSKALAAGKYTAAPNAKIVGEGLESIQGAMDMLKKGVSATKLVVVV